MEGRKKRKGEIETAHGKERKKRKKGGGGRETRRQGGEGKQKKHTKSAEGKKKKPQQQQNTRAVATGDAYGLVLVLGLLGGSVVLLLALLATTTKAEDKVKGGLLLDVVVGEGAAILKLLAGEDEALLIRGDALLVLDLGLDVLDGVRGLHLEGDGLAREGLHKDLHDWSAGAPGLQRGYSSEGKR